MVTNEPVFTMLRSTLGTQPLDKGNLVLALSVRNTAVEWNILLHENICNQYIPWEAYVTCDLFGKKCFGFTRLFKSKYVQWAVSQRIWKGLPPLCVPPGNFWEL